MASYFILLGINSCITICDLENLASIKNFSRRYEILNDFKPFRKFIWFKKQYYTNQVYFIW